MFSFIKLNVNGSDIEIGLYTKNIKQTKNYEKLKIVTEL